MPNSVSSPAAAPGQTRRRIGFCITDLDAGGAEKALVQIVTRLDPTLWEPIVYCLGPEAELVAPLRARGIAVHCFGARSWLSWIVLWNLTKALRRDQPQLLQCFLFHANLLGRIAARRAGVPIVLAGHRVAQRDQPLRIWLDWATGWLVRRHVCVSQGVARFVRRRLWVRKDHITVIPNGVDPALADVPPADLSQEFNIPAGAPVVLAVGRLHPQKGFLDLLRAFRIASRRFPATHLLIIGEGPQRAELQRRVKELSLTTHVHLPGRRSDVAAIMRSCQLLAVSSLWEGMPNVILEAMAVGLPVVTTPVEGTDELIQHGRTGALATAGGVQGFAAELERMLGSPQWRETFAGAAQQQVRQANTWDAVAAGYAALFTRLLS